MNLREKNLFLLDLDGTTYIGDKLLPWVKEFIELLRKKGKKYIFLTNNSSRDGEFYSSKLRKLGIEVTPHEIFTSGEATASFLKSLKRNPRIYLLGTPELARVFRNAGCIITEEDPEFVVVGFDTTLTYEKLKKTCLFVRKGLTYIATHPDINCPTEEGLIPDAGSIIALIKASTGREPDYIFGKPQKEFILGAIKKVGVKKEEAAIIGDRLYTDIKAGLNAGIETILVLTGETSREDLENSEIKPDLVVETFETLCKLLHF